MMPAEGGAAAPLNLHEYETAARAALSPMAYGYVAGGAEDEVTLRENRAAFGRWRLLPRVLRGVVRPRLETTVLGQDVSVPVLLAPVAFHRLAHAEGEIATARAAGRAGTILVLSTASTCAMEEVAPHAGRWWFQLYLYQDREVTRDLVARAESAGAAALVVTVDTPVLGRREADVRQGFTLPEGLTFANLLPAALRHMPAPTTGSGLQAYTTLGLEPAIGWRDLDWLAGITHLPVVPKGILAPEDARLAVEHGARAILVSNHGGRQLDGAVATLDALPGVVEAADGRAEALLDGGVRRGTDILKALALGARAVLIGRPQVWGLAVGGEAGVYDVLDLLRTELETALHLCGLAGVSEASRALLVPAGSVALTEGTRPRL